MMNKVLIFGNSGSGKTTLALKMARDNHLPHLDLDILAWRSPGVRKPFKSSLSEVNQFIESNERWVIEGCYGSLIREAAAFCTELLFLNPGIEACIKNNLSRPWEPHKYASQEAQNKNLEMLQEWVGSYETRNDEYSLRHHREIFSGFKGQKQEITSILDHESPMGSNSNIT